MTGTANSTTVYTLIDVLSREERPRSHYGEEEMVRRRSRPNLFGLSTREFEVLGWLAEGKTNGEIGVILRISHRTVGKHLERIYRKLGVETRTAAAKRALIARPRR